MDTSDHTADEFFIPEHITLSVKRGAYFLDGKIPGWEARLDLSNLWLEDSCRCVLGQLYKDFSYGASLLGLNTDPHGGGSDAISGETVDLGFLASRFVGSIEGRTEYAQLTEAWKREVSTRLGDVA